MWDKIKKNKFWIGIAIIFIVRMILISVQHPFSIYIAGNDDAFVLGTAERLLSLDWLGPYNSLTLSKGIFASVFIAIANILGIPFLMANHLFYAIGCLLLVKVLRKAVKNDFTAIGLYGVLMFNPALFCTQLTRVYRDYINSSLLVYLVASLFGIFFNYKEKWTKLIGYMILLGLSFTAMYTCREEAIWVLPVIIVAIFMTVLFIVLDKECKEKFKKLILYLIPTAIFVIIICVICGLNYKAYGLFTLNQYSGKTWNDFLDAISSVKIENDYDEVPVEKEAREKLYEVSPTFATLKPYFEGDVGDNWAINGNITGEIEEGWFSWALINIVDCAGYYTSAQNVNEFFKNVTSEVNAAYEDGRLEKKEDKNDFFTAEHISNLFINAGKAHEHQVNLDGNPIRNSVDEWVEDPDVPSYQIDKFREITGEVATNSLTYNYFVDDIKVRSLEKILYIYQKISPVLFIVAVGSYAIGFVLLFIIKKTRFKNYKEMTFLTGILGLYIIRLFVIAYVETDMMAGAIYTMYLSSTYSMLFAFEFLAPCLLIRSIYRALKNKDMNITKKSEKIEFLEEKNV